MNEFELGLRDAVSQEEAVVRRMAALINEVESRLRDTVS